MYLFLDPLALPPIGPPPIAVLDTAEASVLPKDGLRAQVAHSLHLDAHEQSMGLAPEQLFGMRPAGEVWRRLRFLCAHCFARLDRPLHRCSGCERVRYCSKECQKQ